MRNFTITFLSIIILSICLSSCSSYTFSKRSNKDVYLTSNNYTKIKGFYLIDSNSVFILQSFGGRFDDLNETKKMKKDYFVINKTKNYYIEVVPLDEKKLIINLYQNDSVGNNVFDLITTKKFKGKFRNGYFKISSLGINFVVGPLMWVMGGTYTYIGLTKNNNLVILESGGVGILFIGFIPIFIAGGDESSLELNRIK